MITNINFPEGTKVTYQVGSRWDQFSSGVSINIPSPNVYGGAYTGSQLGSARELDITHSCYCYYSRCVYRPIKTEDSYNMFYNGRCYYDLIFDKETAITIQGICSGATTKGVLRISGNFSNIQDALYSANKTRVLYLDVDTSALVSARFRSLLNYTIVTVFGGVSVKSLTNITYSELTGYSRSKIRQITVLDIGYNTSQTSVNFSYWDWWGYNHTVAPNARQSLIDSLITYSFDRAAAGYSNCTITLSAKTKSLLTEEEIAQITAKGFTIA